MGGYIFNNNINITNIANDMITDQGELVETGDMINIPHSAILFPSNNHQMESRDNKRIISYAYNITFSSCYSCFTSFIQYRHQIDVVKGKIAKKISSKKSGLLPNLGGGSRRVVKCQTSILEKVFFSVSI